MQYQSTELCCTCDWSLLPPNQQAIKLAEALLRSHGYLVLEPDYYSQPQVDTRFLPTNSSYGTHYYNSSPLSARSSSEPGDYSRSSVPFDNYQNSPSFDTFSLNESRTPVTPPPSRDGASDTPSRAPSPAPARAVLAVATVPSRSILPPAPAPFGRSITVKLPKTRPTVPSYQI